VGPVEARIIVRGKLSDRLARAFEGMTLVRHPGRTELVGEIADQAQLHGLLARIRDLGLELQHLSVTPEERADGSTGKPEGRSALLPVSPNSKGLRSSDCSSLRPHH
jgi:hypothetical protein